MEYWDDIKCQGCGEKFILRFYGHQNFDRVWCLDCYEAMSGEKWEDV